MVPPQGNVVALTRKEHIKALKYKHMLIFISNKRYLLVEYNAENLCKYATVYLTSLHLNMELNTWDHNLLWIESLTFHP